MGPRAITNPSGAVGFHTARARLAAFAGILLVYWPLAGLRESLSIKLILWSLVALAGAYCYALTGGRWWNNHWPLKRALVYMAGLFLAGWAILFLVALVTPALPPAEVAPSQLAAMPAALILIQLVLKPVTEELAFRGFLYDAVASRGAVVAVLTTSAIDFAAHWFGHSLHYALYTLGAAVVIGLLRAWTGGLALPVLFHGIFDTLLS